MIARLMSTSWSKTEQTERKKKKVYTKPIKWNVFTPIFHLPPFPKKYPFPCPISVCPFPASTPAKWYMV